MAMDLVSIQPLLVDQTSKMMEKETVSLFYKQIFLVLQFQILQEIKLNAILSALSAILEDNVSLVKLVMHCDRQLKYVFLATIVLHAIKQIQNNAHLVFHLKF